MNTDTKKISVMIALFAAWMTLSLGNQSGSLAMAVPSAFADSSHGHGVFQETICHYPIGNEINPQTITVGEPAVLNAHLHHGDTYGECPLICPPGAISCMGADGTPGLAGYGTPSFAGPSSQRELKGS